jgi:transposase
MDHGRTLAEVERDYIAAALRASGGNRARAAERLGIGAATLYRKLKQERRWVREPRDDSAGDPTVLQPSSGFADIENNRSHDH